LYERSTARALHAATIELYYELPLTTRSSRLSSARRLESEICELMHCRLIYRAAVLCIWARQNGRVNLEYERRGSRRSNRTRCPGRSDAEASSLGLLNHHFTLPSRVTSVQSPPLPRFNEVEIRAGRGDSQESTA
jgi:hypothetical protein